jgi:hypothetical protein
VNKRKQAFVPAPAHLVPQFVQAGLDRSPIQPAFRILAVRLAGHGPLETNFDSELLGSRRVPYYLRDHAGETRVMGTKDPLDIRPGIVGFGSNNGFTECVHVAMSPPDDIL